MSIDTDTVQVSRSYLLEKGCTALSELGAMYEALERTDLSEGQLRDELRSHLSVALYDFTKILSEISGTTWDSEDREKVASGVDGVEELLVRYGYLKPESTRAWRVRTAG